MVRDWRTRFQYDFPFLWVQISPWEGHEAATSSYRLPKMRAAQMAVQNLPLTAGATAVDLGSNASEHGWDTGDEHGPDPWGNVHFRHKGPLGPRLAACAQAIVYGNSDSVYRGPEAIAAMLVKTSINNQQQVEVSFDSATVSGGLTFRENRCPYEVLRDEANATHDIDCPTDISNCVAK